MHGGHGDERGDGDDGGEAGPGGLAEDGDRKQDGEGEIGGPLRADGPGGGVKAGGEAPGLDEEEVINYSVMGRSEACGGNCRRLMATAMRARRVRTR